MVSVFCIKCVCAFYLYYTKHKDACASGPAARVPADWLTDYTFRNVLG